MVWLVDRSAGAIDLGIPIESLLSIDIPAWNQMNVNYASWKSQYISRVAVTKNNEINFVATSIDELNTFRSLVEFSEFNISPNCLCTFSPIELDKICSGHQRHILQSQTDSSSMDCIEVYLSEPSNRLTNGLSDNLI